MRLRLIGGALPEGSLGALLEVAEAFGDGRLHVTSRANLQVRALPATADGLLTPEVLAALRGTGLLPSSTHELVRNVVVSPQTGVAGGHADLRPIAARLDQLLCAAPRLAALPGRFLFVLDDGRGDLLEREADLGLVVLDPSTAQLRVGARWGPVVALAEAADKLVDLALRFQDHRGQEPTAPWHVDELDASLVEQHQADPGIPEAIGPLGFGPVAGGRHVAAPDDGLDRVAVDALAVGASRLVVTPWRGVLVVEEAVR